MENIIIGVGENAGKGVYAERDFETGELVVSYDLRELTPEQFNALPQEEKPFVHSFWGKRYLFAEPARYVNHALHPNTRQNLQTMGDYAIHPIKKGEMITTNAVEEIENEVITFIESRENAMPTNIDWSKKSYQSVECAYTIQDIIKKISLVRQDGNWVAKESELFI